MPQDRYAVRIFRSCRKTVSVQILSPGEVTVRAPLKMPESEIRRLLETRQSWIETHLQKAVRQTEIRTAQPKMSREELNVLAQEALTYLPARVRKLASAVGVSFGRITIRNQKTRWGSCSGRGNLNFNCMLMLCPPEIRDYVVVHELCHRKEMNHSPRFWAEVERILPDYRTSVRWLKDNGPAILSRLPE